MEVINKIILEMIDNNSNQEICDYLNDNELFTIWGKKWNESNLRHYIVNNLKIKDKKSRHFFSDSNKSFNKKEVIEFIQNNIALSDKELIAILNEKGIKTSRNLKWNKDNFAMFRNQNRLLKSFEIWQNNLKKSLKTSNLLGKIGRPKIKKELIVKN